MRLIEAQSCRRTGEKHNQWSLSGQIALHAVDMCRLKHSFIIYNAEMKNYVCFNFGRQTSARITNQCTQPT